MTENIIEKRGATSDSDKLTVTPEVARLAAQTRFPYPFAEQPPQLSNEEKIEIISDHFREIMGVLGLDVNDPSLARTPYRVAKMYVEEIFSGLDLDKFPTISFIDDHFSHDERANMVFVKVNFNSFCEHHFVPMNGTAYVAYIPNGKLIGLSKIPRIVRYFASRPQVQERLSAQVADALSILMETESVAVSIMAKHFCVIARGIEDADSVTVTNVLRGDFDIDDALRREFFEAINRK